jgi:phosphoribosyl-dephospho-CoA transferase
MILRAHDLLRITNPDPPFGDTPAWVRHALVRTPWVVVRRSSAPVGLVAIGVRGCDRSHRFALTIAHGEIADVITPEDLSKIGVGSGDVPAMRALTEARTQLDGCAMPWGPTGSVGFELATGIPTATPDSDLDLIVRSPVLTSPVLQRLFELHARLQGLSARVDCQIDTVNGAVALNELAAAPSRVLLKTPAGAVLVPTEELFV